MRYVKLYKERECNALWLEGEIGECGAGEYVDISGMAPFW